MASITQGYSKGGQNPPDEKGRRPDPPVGSGLKCKRCDDPDCLHWPKVMRKGVIQISADRLAELLNLQPGEEIGSICLRHPPGVIDVTLRGGKRLPEVDEGQYIPHVFFEDFRSAAEDPDAD